MRRGARSGSRWFLQGAVSADYNNDGRPDLFSLPAWMVRRCFCATMGRQAPMRRPRARWRFTNVADIRGPSPNRPSVFQCWFWDYKQRRLARIFRVRASTFMTSGISPRSIWGCRSRPATEALPQQRRRHVHRRHEGMRTRPSSIEHGRQLRRSRQRRLARLLPGDGQSGSGHTDPQPDVPKRSRPAFSRRDNSGGFGS